MILAYLGQPQDVTRIFNGEVGGRRTWRGEVRLDWKMEELAGCSRL